MFLEAGKRNSAMHHHFWAGGAESSHREFGLDCCMSSGHPVDAETEWKRERGVGELILHMFFYFSHSLARLCRAAVEFFRH